ncbi:MAG: hypothetical protein IPO02_15720 [Bacteroidetes bacterium]|nr:hypothetical protein [Bacteroidota bacterium]
MFPNCSYYGVDMDRNTDYTPEDFTLMTDFYELDLTKLQYDSIPDQYFDYINMAHVIEHLHNGDQVIPLLLKNLNLKAIFILNTLVLKFNPAVDVWYLKFYDDPTHVRVYSVSELKPVFENNQCKVIQSGIRRNWFYIIATPLRILISLIQIGKVRANVFWDLLGFAEFLFVQKKGS